MTSSVNPKPIGTGDPDTDPLGLGQGALVDADLPAETARLRALHVEQFGARGALPVGPVPLALLSLFRHAPCLPGEPNAQPHP